MDEATLSVCIDPLLHQQGKAFVAFLSRAASKHAVKLNVSSNGPGQFTFSISRKQNEAMDLFLQELMVNHGVYYYLCSLPNRREIARQVVQPIFEELLEFSYEFLFPFFVRKHFNNIHGLRTRGLHRLEREMPDAEIRHIAQQMYFAFEYINDYFRAQD